ncbi:molybdopterin-dependent oxidoreductase [Chloroflexota bacterium]
MLCIKGATSLDYLTNPKRLRYPQKRVGAIGDGKWQQITWDEAFNTIADKFTKLKGKYGAESIAFIWGGAKGYQDTWLARFANIFGSPNISSMALISYVCRAYASSITYGAMLFPDYEYPPALILMWAANTHNTAIGEWKRTTDALKKGAKLIVIDPWQSEFAKEAQVWVKPRPCTDLALALGMMNVIINENLYDKNFVAKWTVGFDKLKAHIQAYSPEKVAEITWVPAETIRQIARMYATTKPACLIRGNGIDNNVNNVQVCRALAILRAITGNLGKPGTDVEWSPSGVLSKGSPDLSAQNALSAEVRAKRLNAKDGMMPIVFYTLPQGIVKSILTGKPYPIKAAFVQGANLLHTLPNSNETLTALTKLDFMVVTDYYMTPTAELADIVLPVAMFLEIDSLHEGEYIQAANVIQKVAQTGECLSDYQIYMGLAKRLGMSKYFWDTDKGLLDFIMESAGLSFDEFRKVGQVSGSKQYRKYEKTGFNTPSGKVEIYSSKLAEWGFPPLPVYIEPPESPLSAVDLYKDYPFVFTNHKIACFHHARDRYNEALRRCHPEPIVHIQTDTARRLGIKERDMVYIETKRGKVKQKANLVLEIDPRVIIADYGWWFPERDASTLYGWSEANLNILTDNSQPWSKEMGTPTLRGIVCNIYKAV